MCVIFVWAVTHGSVRTLSQTHMVGELTHFHVNPSRYSHTSVSMENWLLEMGIELSSGACWHLRLLMVLCNGSLISVCCCLSACISGVVARVLGSPCLFFVVVPGSHGQLLPWDGVLVTTVGKRSPAAMCPTFSLQILVVTTPFENVEPGLHLINYHGGVVCTCMACSQCCLHLHVFLSVKKKR